MFVIYEELYNRTLHSCEKEQYTVKNKEIVNSERTVRNSTVYIWAECMIHSTFHVAAANVVLVCLHTCRSLVLLQRAPVSQQSKQTAEHSHFTLLNLSHMASTPVAAFSSETQIKLMHYCLKLQICSCIHSMLQ